NATRAYLRGGGIPEASRATRATRHVFGSRRAAYPASAGRWRQVGTEWCGRRGAQNMPTNITMPQLGESVSEGTIGQWLKQEGDTIKRDESLVEIITDKVTAELPSPVSGRLVKILVQADETVKVGTPIAEVEEGAGATASSPSEAASASATSSAASAPATASAGPSGNGYGGPTAQASSNG